jgi:hypothetical protein
LLNIFLWRGGKSASTPEDRWIMAAIRCSRCRTLQTPEHELAEEPGDDREAYTHAKTAFIEEVCTDVL